MQQLFRCLHPSLCKKKKTDTSSQVYSRQKKIASNLSRKCRSTKYGNYKFGSDPIPGQVTHIIPCMHAVVKHGRLSIRPEYNHSIGGCMHRWVCGWINGSLDRSTRSDCEVCIAAPTADWVSSPCLRAHIHICMHKKTWMQGGSVVSLDASFSLRMREKERDVVVVLWESERRWMELTHADVQWPVVWLRWWIKGGL
jgi:hypothetical protein